MTQSTRWGHLGNRIIGVAAVAVAVGFAVMIAIIAKQSYDAAVEQGNQLASEQAGRVADSVEAKLANGFAIPRSMAASVQGLQRAQAVERKVVDNILLSSLDNAPGIIGAWMIWEPNALDGRDDEFRRDWPKHDPSGRYTPYLTRGGDGKAALDVMMSSDRVAKFPEWQDRLTEYAPDYEKSGWGDFYFVPKSRGRDTITEPFFYEVQGKQVLESSLAVVMKDASGKLLGVSAVDLALDDLQKQFGAIRLYDTGYVRMVSEGGLFVVNPQAGQVGKAVASGDPLAANLDKIKKGERFVYEDGGFTHFFYPIKVADSGQFWSAGVSVPTAAITATANSQRNTAIVVGVIALALIILVLTLLIRTLTRPLNTLAETMEQFASGKGDLTLRLTVSNRDEIGRTAAAFNRFIESLREMFIEVREQSLAVSRSAGQLADSAVQVEQSSAQQSDAASATAAGVEQVTVSVHHIADTAMLAESMARETGVLTEHSVATVDKVTGEIQRMTSNMQALAGRMGALGARSAEVSTIVGVIKDIADQTNLLALNAAIEAARAGEQGRGFAVVADEVRNLAGRTAEATVQISRIVNAISSETNDAVDEVKRSTELVSVSVGIAEEANVAMKGVYEKSVDLVDNIGDIASSTREQSNATSEIAQNVERISTMAQSNSEVAREVRAAVEQLREQSASLEALVGNFRL
ncbi:methyl-accepting chemotaxis protein [Vogesella indigofera]|uniref:methyl-accepting chemotaxis protein n=1 Tax=Vogesella indigofera TaxID=45465 RepID=UPI00234E92D0|nr:methyl-accepting chemotaxis protein [Vogesella indigofera]MDC7697295.1 methyl-accepting chemotaxis protein [Vogesella indigofera]